MDEPVLLGTKLKYLVSIKAVGFTMLDDDFKITLTRGGVSMTFEKSDLVFDGENYYLAFDTTDFGPGKLFATIYAYVPDSDFGDGIRTEKFKIKLTTIKS